MAEFKVSKKAYNDIARKIERLIKKRVIELELIDSGYMRDHTYVKPDYEGGFDIDSTDYFKFLDKGTKFITAFDITDYVMNSTELNDYITERIGEDYTDYLDLQINEMFKDIK